MAQQPGDNVRTFTVGEDDDGIRLDRWFKRHLPDVSFNIVSRWARTGQLRVDGKRAAPGDRLETGQVLRVPPAEAAPAEGPGARPKRIVQPLSADEAAFVQDMVLDKDTSGVLLVARSARAAGHFTKAFAGRTARKVYWAIITGVPSAEEGTIDAPLAKQPGTGGEKMHVDHENGLPAKTRYRLIDRAGNRAAWVELQPLTGRTHQLRAHMAAIGHPIVGDAKYGGADAFLTGGISRKLHLHARRLKIEASIFDLLRLRKLV